MQANPVITLVLIGAFMFLVIGGLSLLSHYYTLSGIKSRTIGDGQHGTARFATKGEVRSTYVHIPYTPEQWRQAPTIDEVLLHSAILRALNHLTAYNDRLMQGIQNSLIFACTGERIGVDAVALQNQVNERSAAMMKLVDKELRKGVTAQDVERMCGEIAAEIEGLKAQLQQHEQEQGRIRGENHRIKDMMALLDGEAHDFTAYDDALVRRMVESIRVVTEEKIVIRFGWGVEVEEHIG